MKPPHPNVSSPTPPAGKGPPETLYPDAPRDGQDTADTRKDGTCRVLVVEDDPTFAKLLTQILGSSVTQRYESDVADTVREATRRLRRDSYDVIIADLGLPDSAEYQTIERLTAAAPNVPIVVLTGTAEDGVAPSLEAVRRGASYFLRKGSVDAAAVERGIHYATERKALSALLDGGGGKPEP